jgi:hypothetical protein
MLLYASKRSMKAKVHQNENIGKLKNLADESRKSTSR